MPRRTILVPHGGPMKFSKQVAAFLSAVLVIASGVTLGVSAPASAQEVASSLTGRAVANSAGANQIPGTRGDIVRQPNIVVFQTDDQTVQDLSVMPGVRALIARQGVTFNQMVTPFPICCPSRAAEMTGSYPHNNGVNANFPPSGGFVPWEKKSGNKQIGKWLQDAGYYTAHIGKYINGYAFPNRPRAKVPTGWSEWHGSADPSTYQMYGYRLNEPDGSHQYGKFPVQNPKYYSSDVYGRKAAKIVREQAKRPGPFYMQVEFLAPHVETVPLKRGFIPQSWADVDNPNSSTGIQTIPPRPALRHRNFFNNMPLEEDASFNEADVSDKGSFVRNLPLLTSDQIDDLVEDNRARRRSLLAVDEAITKVIHELKKTKQDRNTVIVMMGDNGYLLGQHRISMGKYFPYEPALQIPFMMSGPGIRRNQTESKLVSLIDLAPTLLDMAHAKATGRKPDGMSLRRTLAGLGSPRTRSVLLSSGPQRGPNGEYLPLYDGVRSANFAWWRYEDGFEEMYDLRSDPYELTNIASDPAYASTRALMIAEWNRLKNCKGTSCQKPSIAP